MSTNKLDGYEPLHDYVMVELHPQEVRSKGGLIIPEKAQEKSRTGWVRRIGPKVQDLEPGKSVMFAEYAGQQFKYDGFDGVILRYEDLISIVPEPGETDG